MVEETSLAGISAEGAATAAAEPVDSKPLTPLRSDYRSEASKTQTTRAQT
jgi:hypothetical protein